MALLRERKLELAEMDLPSEAETRAMIDQFVMRSGFTEGDLALAIGVSRSLVNLFRLGRTNDRVPGRASNTLELRAKLKQYFDEHPLTGPHAFACDQLYPTATVKKLREVFYRALDHGWAYCVDGAPGT